MAKVVGLTMRNERETAFNFLDQLKEKAPNIPDPADCIRWSIKDCYGKDIDYETAQDLVRSWEQARGIPSGSWY
jgi:hypothetical protein